MRPSLPHTFSMWLAPRSYLTDMPLPIPAPVPALGVVQRIGGHPLVLGAVVLAAHVLPPRHLAGIEAQVDAADVVVLAELGPAQAVKKLSA